MNRSIMNRVLGSRTGDVLQIYGDVDEWVLREIALSRDVLAARGVKDEGPENPARPAPAFCRADP